MSNILSVKNILVLVLMFLLVPGLVFVDNSAKANDTSPNISPLISFQEAYPSEWDDDGDNINWTPAGLFNGLVPTDGTVLTACLDADHVPSFSGQIAFVVASTGKTYTLNTLNAQGQAGFGTPSKPGGSVWDSSYDNTPPEPKEQCVTKIIVTSNDTTLSFFNSTETIGVDKDACVYYKHQNASDWTGGRCISLDGNPGPMTSAFENSSVAVGAVADPENSTAEMPVISSEFSYYMLVVVFLITGYAIIHRLPELISEKN